MVEDRRGFDPFAPPLAQGSATSTGPKRPAEPKPPTVPEDTTNPVSIPADDELEAMRKPDLQDLAGKLGLDPAGFRADLIERVRAAR